MLKIYNPANPADVIPFPIGDDKRFVIHKYNGYDTLQFEIENNHSLYQYITEEGKIEDEKNRYVVKTIDEHSSFVTVKCELDLDDWKNEIVYEFRTTNKALSDVIAMILPNGWIVRGDGQFTKRTTVEGNQGEPLSAVTHLEILDAAAEAYSCVFNFDVPNKTLSCIDPTTFKPSGQFFTDELNLKSIGFVGSTSEGFATRLYAFGKKDEDGNPLTFASINDGKAYVEDHTYTDKIVCVGWSDERYSNQESLLAAAKAKLRQISFPSRSYTCDARNLNEDVWMYKMVTLIDRRRKSRVNHQIVEWKEYPKHALDSVTLSKTAGNIESHVKKLKEDLSVKIEDETSTMQQILQAAIDNATDMITGNKGGSFCWVYDQNEKPIELLNLGDTDDINTAKQVWRWNASGLGHSNTGYDGAYALALLADGSINADVITAGTLNANIIRAGKLTDVKGNNYWDLETGEFKLTSSVKVQDGNTEKTLSEYLDVDVDLTQAKVFNALTNNGANKGIYMSSGELYINATYIAAGELADTNRRTVFNLSTGDLTMKRGSISLGGRFEVDSYGYLTAEGAVINGSIRSDNGYAYIELYDNMVAGGNTRYGYDDMHGYLDLSHRQVDDYGNYFNNVCLVAVQDRLILGAVDEIYFTDQSCSGWAWGWVNSSGVHSTSGTHSLSTVALPTEIDDEGRVVSYVEANLNDGMLS